MILNPETAGSNLILPPNFTKDADKHWIHVTHFVIPNPMRQKTWETLLRANESRVKAELVKWRDAWFKKLLPAAVYRKFHSGKKRHIFEVAQYMASHGIRYENPNGMSLQRLIYKENRVVAVFDIRIHDTKQTAAAE